MGWKDKIFKSHKVEAGVQKKAEAVKDYWASISPVFGDRPPHRSAPAHGAPGAYKDSIKVTDTSSGDGPLARVSDGDFKAKWIEFGNKHMPPYAPLAKTKANFR